MEGKRTFRTAAEQRAVDAEDGIRLAVYRLALAGHQADEIGRLVNREGWYVLETLDEFVRNRVLALGENGRYLTVKDHENPATRPKTRTRAESQG